MEIFKMQQQIAGEIDYNYVVCVLRGLASAYANKEIGATLERKQSLTQKYYRTLEKKELNNIYVN